MGPMASKGDDHVMEPQHVFLVPGFFGFTNLGDLPYFAHVRVHLEAAFRRLGRVVEIHTVRTHPTASVRRRAEILLETVAEKAKGATSIHLVGHSSGGLDARLFTTPSASLAGGIDLEEHACRVRTVVTLVTPHHGTPIATFFNTLMGQQLLRLLSLATVYVLRFGRLPLSVLLRLGASLARSDDWLGLGRTVADQAYRQLLSDFSPQRREEVKEFMEKMSEDTRLLGQLTSAGMDMFNATATDRPGVRYGSVVCGACPPGLRTTLKIGLDPYAQATHLIYGSFFRIAAKASRRNMPVLTGKQAHVLEEAFGDLGPEVNDGIVPTLSQVWGEVIHAVRADHLDVIGHFNGPEDSLPHYDWFASGCAFDQDSFMRLWDDVAAFIADGRSSVT